MQDLTKQTGSQSNLQEGNQAADKRLSSRGESTVLNAIFAHLEKWYPKEEVVDIVEEITESERAA